MTKNLDSSLTAFAQNDEIGAEVALGDFVDFRARNYEIELMVHRIVERDESRKSVKETNAPYAIVR